MEEQHDKDHPDTPARYTIISHSLGTVMAMDSLLFARAKASVKTGPPGFVPNLPFRGYMNADEIKNARAWFDSGADTSSLPEGLECLNSDWINHVDSWVTLGSPIDKYLYLWWLNYEYHRR